MPKINKAAIKKQNKKVEEEINKQLKWLMLRQFWMSVYEHPPDTIVVKTNDNKYIESCCFEINPEVGSVTINNEPKVFLNHEWAIRSNTKDKWGINDLEISHVCFQCDKWARFLMNEKLDPNRLIDLCNELTKIRNPRIKPYKEKLESRRLVCEVAIDLGIDLGSIKNKYGKIAMTRGLLDMWNTILKERFGDNFGTNTWKEAKRRDLKK